MSGDLVENGSLECLVQYAPFASRPRRARAGAGAPSDEERAASRALEDALGPCMLLDRFPKSVIEVHVNVLEAGGGGGEVCACVCAASLALAQAGIDMVDVCAAAAVAGRTTAAAAGAGAGAGSGAQPSSSPAARLLVDPTADESRAASFSTTVALMPRAGTVTLAAHSGQASPEDVLAAMRLAMDGCATIFEQMRAVLVADARKRAAKAMSGSGGAAAAAAAAAARAGKADVGAGAGKAAPAIAAGGAGAMGDDDV